MAKDLEIGEIVYLNSGSPPMTVAEISSSDNVEVVWMSGHEERTSVFPCACVTRQDPRAHAPA